MLDWARELKILYISWLVVALCLFFNSSLYIHSTQSVINMGTKVYNNVPIFFKEIDDYRAFKRELKLFFLLQTFYSVEEFVFS
jgi:hypothetical protein